MTSYRAVIGLAGHVDHGKTLLIKALTGITTARAHEQAIGMTQDLGFAHFDDGQGNTIGVIDVPGHERYIRNMVAGLWSLDLVLLVIAADEGWMPMTGACSRPWECRACWSASTSAIWSAPTSWRSLRRACWSG